MISRKHFSSYQQLVFAVAWTPKAISAVSSQVILYVWMQLIIETLLYGFKLAYGKLFRIQAHLNLFEPWCQRPNKTTMYKLRITSLIKSCSYPFPSHLLHVQLNVLFDAVITSSFKSKLFSFCFDCLKISKAFFEKEYFKDFWMHSLSGHKQHRLELLYVLVNHPEQHRSWPDNSKQQKVSLWNTDQACCGRHRAMPHLCKQEERRSVWHPVVEEPFSKWGGEQIQKTTERPRNYGKLV